MGRIKRIQSRAEGKRFGTTSITPEKTQGDIQTLLKKWNCEASQWTTLLYRYDFRFKLNGRSYLFSVPNYKDDEQETRRLFRVIYWYLDTMLAAQDSELFSPEKVFLAFLEVAPEVTLSSALEDSEKLSAIRGVLGGGQLALGG